MQVPFRPFETELRQIAGNERHDGLTLGITKAAIVFDDLGTISGEHQPKIKEALVVQPVFFQTCNRRGDNLIIDPLHKLGISQLATGDSAHSTGIRPFVPLPDSLVIAGWC